MASTRPVQRFRDIIEHIDLIRDMTRVQGADVVVENVAKRLAAERAMMIIAEAASKLGELAEQLAPGVPWHEIRGFGNRLRHEYDDFDPNILASTIKRDLPILREACEQALRHPDLQDSK